MEGLTGIEPALSAWEAVSRLPEFRAILRFRASLVWSGEVELGHVMTPKGT